jgi:hypothetical protein
MSRAYLAVACPYDAKVTGWTTTIASTVAGTTSVERGRKAAAAWAAYNPKFARQLRDLAPLMRPDVANAVKAVAAQVSSDNPFLRDLAIVPQRQVSFARYTVRLTNHQALQANAGNEVRRLLGLPLNGWCPVS